MNNRKELARFMSDHLPEPLQMISQPFLELAAFVCAELPDTFERTEALTKLLEAKDSAVRAFVFN